MTTPSSDSRDPIEHLRVSAILPLRESAKLLDSLHFERGEHKHFQLAYDKDTAKRYFLSECLIAVQMASLSLLRFADYLQGDPSREDAASTGFRAIANASLATEHGVWRRRLVEVLATAINFSASNLDECYYHYLLLFEAVCSEREAKSADLDFGAKSATLAQRSHRLRELIATTGQSLSQPAWWAHNARGVLTPQPATVMVRTALRAATPMQKTALAHSYSRGFSDPSELLHFGTAARRQRLDQELLRFGAAQIFLLGMSICEQVARLAANDLPWAETARAHHRSSAWEDVHPGDFVFVTLDRENIFLAEVMSQTSAPGGGRAVRVRFLEDPPYPGIVEDDFPSDLVHMFQSIDGLMTEVEKASPRIQAAPRDERLQACKESVKYAWTIAMKKVYLHGLREGEWPAELEVPMPPI